MAPTISGRSSDSTSILNHLLARALSSMSNSLSITSRSPSSPTIDSEKPPSLSSVFATILRGSAHISRRAMKTSLLTSRHTHPSSPPSPDSLLHPIFLSPAAADLHKRQQPVLAIPTTYAGLNSGPAPGALVGIVLGSIAGFILILYVVLSAIRLSGFSGRETVEVAEVHHHRRRSRTRSHTRSHTSSPRRERIVREREERVVVEEHMEESVIVDEEPDDIVEVIEEHSPERPVRKESRRSGYRTVDPAEFAGGRAPMRKLSKR